MQRKGARRVPKRALVDEQTGLRSNTECLTTLVVEKVALPLEVKSFFVIYVSFYSVFINVFNQ